MSKQSKPLSIALGTVLAAGLGAAGIANATEEGADLFAMEEMQAGYLIAGAHETDDSGDDSDEKDGDDKEGEGKCGEGKCGSA